MRSPTGQMHTVVHARNSNDHPAHRERGGTGPGLFFHLVVSGAIEGRRNCSRSRGMPEERSHRMTAVMIRRTSSLNKQPGTRQ